jgi:hypothetical protein
VAERLAELTRQLASAAETTPDLRDEILNHLAARVGTLGVRLSNLGRREEALAASQEAVDLHRRLAAKPPRRLPV